MQRYALCMTELSPSEKEYSVMKKKTITVLLPAAALCAAAYLAVPAAAEAEPAAAALTGWQEQNGKRYYYDAAGKKAVGEVTIEGVDYLFAPNGAQQTGWQSVDGKRYYYAPDGKAEFGWVEWRGETYYVSAKNGKLTGEAVTDEGETYHFDEYGVCVRWQKLEDGSWRYGRAESETEIEGKPYLFTEEGILKTGWQTAADGITRYYDAETHEILTGWITDADKKRYFSDPEKGRQTGFFTDTDGTRYYIDPEKGLLTGWQMIDGKQYKLLDNGAVFTGFYPVNGVTYLFGEDGVLVSGWYKDADGTRYFAENGVMQVGLTEIAGDKYYFNELGLMQTGVLDVPNGDGTFTRCEFGADGKMVKKVTGWQVENGVKHYINADGTMATAPTVIDGKTYLFDMNGNLVTGLFTAANGSKYYGDENGAAVTGWVELPNQSSYFNASGVMAVSTVIDGYTIDINGAARNSRAVTVDNNLKNTNGTIYSVYQNFCANYSYSAVEVARTSDQLMTAGWDKLIDPTLSRRRGLSVSFSSPSAFLRQRSTSRSSAQASRAESSTHGMVHIITGARL